MIGGLGGHSRRWGTIMCSHFCSQRSVCTTRGVHNLHGMPALFGALASIIFVETKRDPGLANAEGEAGGYQAAALFVTLAISCGAGC